MLNDLLMHRSKLLQEALHIRSQYGKDADFIVHSILEWHKDHPLDGQDLDFVPKNFDYGDKDSLQGRLDRYKKKTSKSLKKKIYDAYVIDMSTKSYCVNKENTDYWSQGKNTKATREFLRYINQVEC